MVSRRTVARIVPTGRSKVLLCGDKHVVPKTRFQVSLEFGEVKVRPGSLGEEAVDVMEKVESKVHQRTRCDTSVHSNVSFVQVPSAGTDKEDSRLVLGSVDLAIGRVGVGDGTADSVTQVQLSLHQIAPGGTGGVFKVSHVDVGTTVESVDDHLAIDGASDFHATILDVLGDAGTAPGRIAGR